ncbi:MAG: MFS transporter, partial [Pirellulales bacterium]|nr:MFS transporter [Pirellulales bacterium]
MMLRDPNYRYYLFVCIVVSLAGILYGFDTAVISGAISPLISFFNLEDNPALLGWTVSSVLLGSVVGASVSGVADKIGRKTVLIMAGLLFTISAMWSSITSDLAVFIVARLLGGLGVGLAAMTAPLYISEISPANKRGSMVSLYQFSITLGVLVAYFTNDLLKQVSLSMEPNDSIWYWFFEEVWRIMLGTEALPALAFTLLMFLVPRSPRYLVSKGVDVEALATLTRINGES